MNIVHDSPTGKNGNTVHSSPKARHWIFTIKRQLINIDQLVQNLQCHCDKYIFQIEKGKETNYEHYQGYIMLKKKEYMTKLKKMLSINEIHLEVCRNIEATIEYCQKGDTRIEGPWIFPEPINILKENELYDWQKVIIDTISKKADSRKIYWYVDELGCKGKTTFGKYLCVKYKACYLNSGKKNDILYHCSLYNSNIYIFDFCRSNENHISYESIEAVKNGIYFVGKYESCQIIRNVPHIIIFSNFEPDITKLSEDRWIINHM